MIVFLVLFLTLAMTVMPEQYSQAQESSLSIMSYNIRYDNPDDAPNNWENRKSKVANLIRYYEPVFVGTQEALFHQVSFLDQQLESYQWIGKGRQDGKKEGEFSALFYDINRVQLVDHSDSTIWLSQTPSKPSKSWDAALQRVLSWGKFNIKATGDSIYVFNTHFDHKGKKARTESAKLILNIIEEIAGNFPVVLTGDFNFVDKSKPYKEITSTFLKDSYISSYYPPLGPSYTFSGFSLSPPTDKKRIDYIFTNHRLAPRKFATISSHRHNFYPSDHLPILLQAEIVSQNEQGQ